ncbi:prephenate dehydratase [soil metagenome]
MNAKQDQHHERDHQREQHLPNEQTHVGVDAGHTVAYLGPSGTFTEQAAHTLAQPGAATLPVSTVQQGVDMLVQRHVGSAVVPFENSVEGSVSVTLDALIRGEPLVITGEAHVAVRFALLARRGSTAADLRRIATHPHAEAQTREWVGRHFPTATIVPESSTAHAAELVAAGEYDAAIAGPLAAQRHDLEVLHDDIADRPGAITRFVRLSLPVPPPPPTGADTTTLVGFLRHNHPGALLELLQQFVGRGVDLTRLESRPTGEALGQYCFAIEANGHISESRMAEALTGLRRCCADVRYLGSYPRADGYKHPIPPEASEIAYQHAWSWVTSLTQDAQPSS